MVSSTEDSICQQERTELKIEKKHMDNLLISLPLPGDSPCATRVSVTPSPIDAPATTGATRQQNQVHQFVKT